VKAVLEDWRSAPVEPKLRAALAFVEKLTLDPASVGPADIAPMRAVGISDEAIEDAVHACTLFSVYDRLADSFEFEIPDEHGFAMSAAMLIKRGYL
jgi:alkylhydroperoxidase family enzyme